MINFLEVNPTLTNVLPDTSSFINTKYNDLGTLESFFSFSFTLFFSFLLIYSFAFISVSKSFTSRYGFMMYFLYLDM